MTTAEIIREDERRAARDSYRATGGSRRRPLKSFMTKDEKKERREAHRDLLALAVAELEDASAFESWVEALELNPTLSAMNAALVALQTPGEVVASSAGWKRQGYRVRKGEHGVGRITAPGFWPLPYFTAAQADAGDIIGVMELQGVRMPAPERMGELRADLGARLSDGEKPRPALDAVAERIRGGG